VASFRRASAVLQLALAEMSAEDWSVRASSFGAIAEDYDRFRPGPPQDGVEWVLSRPCDSAVDIGAGTGALTRELVPRVRNVIAVEPDSRMSAVLAARVARANVLVGTAEALPLRNASVDAVVGSSMWHWVDEARAALEAARVLRPGGVLGLLWSGPDRSQSSLVDLFAGQRQALAPGAWKATARRHRHDVSLPVEAPFAAPETRTLQWSLPVTAEQLVGLAGTYSGFIVLPEAERTRLRDQLGELVHNHPALAGRQEIELPMRCTCWRATRLG
jgi:ubiquinone/menaquinone biosynthesis C-methylase UbiE